MHAFSPHRGLFLETETIEANMEFILKNISDLATQNENESTEIVDKKIDWLRENEA